MVTKHSPSRYLNPRVTDLAIFDTLTDLQQKTLIASAVRIWRSLDLRDAVVSFDFYCDEVPGLWRFLVAEGLIGLALISAEDLDG